MKRFDFSPIYIQFFNYTSLIKIKFKRVILVKMTTTITSTTERGDPTYSLILASFQNPLQASYIMCMR